MEDRLPSRILSYLYLGSLIDSRNEARLLRNGFTHVLNVSESCRYADVRPYRFSHVPLSDYGDSDLKPALKKASTFVTEAKLGGGKVLVHCRHGQNRSPSMVIGYLMLDEGYSLKDAYSHVFCCRPGIAPHKSYFLQLQDIERVVRGTVSLLLEEIGPTVQDLLKRATADS